MLDLDKLLLEISEGQDCLNYMLLENEFENIEQQEGWNACLQHILNTYYK